MEERKPGENDDLITELLIEINNHINNIKGQFFQSDAKNQKVKVLLAATEYLTKEDMTRDDFDLILQDNPKYVDSFGKSITKEIIDKVLNIQIKFQMPGFMDLKEKLNKIEDVDSKQGLCILCSLESAKVLITGNNYQPKLVTNTNMGLSEKLIIDLSHQMLGSNKAQREQFNWQTTGQDFFKYFQSRPPGGVFIITNEDHTFNIFVSNLKNIYLVDSDKHIYKQIKNSDDFKVDLELITREPDHKGKEYDYSHVNEGSQSVFYIGKTHADWNEIKSLSHGDSFSEKQHTEYQEGYTKKI